MTVYDFLKSTIGRAVVAPGLSKSAIKQNLWYLESVVVWATQVDAIDPVQERELLHLIKDTAKNL